LPPTTAGTYSSGVSPAQALGSTRIPTAHNARRTRHQHSSTRDGRDDLVLIAEDSGSIADMLTFLLNKEASSRITGKQRTTILPW
jgi:hypothetical protein